MTTEGANIVMIGHLLGEKVGESVQLCLLMKLLIVAVPSILQM